MLRTFDIQRPARNVECGSQQSQHLGARLTQTVIIVVGLAFEARIAAGVGMHVICGRDVIWSEQNSEFAISRTILKNCRGIISFGVAGGLLPNMPAGTCVVGSEILSGTTRWAADPNWSKNLLLAIPTAIQGKIVGVSVPVAHPQAKRALHANSGAVAVDMESHIVARMAAARGLPFAAIRVITDPAERTLPQVALAAMRPNGTVNIAAMIRSVIRRPYELRALMQTALDVNAARSVLLRTRKALQAVLDRSDGGTFGIDPMRNSMPERDLPLIIV